MIPLLAQVTADPSAQSIKDWLGVLLYLFGVVAAILVVLVYWRQLREKPAETPQPFVVQGHVKFTPEDDHRELVEIVQHLSDSVNQRFVEVARASSASREKIYNLMREQGEKLQGEMKNDLKGVQDSISDLLGAIGEIKGEIKHLSKK